jgi:hypothetical protein
LDPSELLTNTQLADVLIRDEQSHQRQGCPDPATPSASFLSDGDMRAMRAKFPFLSDFSDNFIRSTKPDSLLKMESTTLKLKESEKEQGCRGQTGIQQISSGLLS